MRMREGAVAGVATRREVLVDEVRGMMTAGSRCVARALAAAVCGHAVQGGRRAACDL